MEMRDRLRIEDALAKISHTVQFCAESTREQALTFLGMVREFLSVPSSTDSIRIAFDRIEEAVLEAVDLMPGDVARATPDVAVVLGCRCVLAALVEEALRRGLIARARVGHVFAEFEASAWGEWEQAYFAVREGR